jgi:hypothetical protein
VLNCCLRGRPGKHKKVLRVVCGRKRKEEEEEEEVKEEGGK